MLKPLANALFQPSITELCDGVGPHLVAEQLATVPLHLLADTPVTILDLDFARHYFKSLLAYNRKGIEQLDDLGMLFRLTAFILCKVDKEEVGLDKVIPSDFFRRSQTSKEALQETLKRCFEVYISLYGDAEIWHKYCDAYTRAGIKKIFPPLLPQLPILELIDGKRTSLLDCAKSQVREKGILSLRITLINKFEKVWEIFENAITRGPNLAPSRNAADGEKAALAFLNRHRPRP